MERKTGELDQHAMDGGAGKAKREMGDGPDAFFISLQEVRTCEPDVGRFQCVTPEIVFVKGDERETRTMEISEKASPLSYMLPSMPDTVLFDPEYKILYWTDEFK